MLTRGTQHDIRLAQMTTKAHSVYCYLIVLSDNTFGDWIDARCPIPRGRARDGCCDEENLLWDALISLLAQLFVTYACIQSPHRVGSETLAVTQLRHPAAP